MDVWTAGASGGPAFVHHTSQWTVFVIQQKKAVHRTSDDFVGEHGK